MVDHIINFLVIAGFFAILIIVILVMLAAALWLLRIIARLLQG